MKALPVGDVCLKCHGALEGMDADLMRYPQVQATGDSKGQIRGALTFKRPL